MMHFDVCQGVESEIAQAAIRYLIVINEKNRLVTCVFPWVCVWGGGGGGDIVMFSLVLPERYFFVEIFGQICFVVTECL